MRNLILIMVCQLLLPSLIYAGCGSYSNYEFCDDFEGRALGTSELGVITTAPWEYTWGTHPGGWANCATATDGCIQISSTETKTGTRAIEISLNQEAANINNQFARGIIGNDTTLSGWSAFGGQDEIYVQFDMYFDAAAMDAPAPGRHHLALLFAGAYGNPMTTDMTIYLDRGVDTFTIQARSYNQAASGELYLDNIAWDGGYGDWTPDTTPPDIVNETWYKIKFYMLMNTFTEGVANRDGEFKLWINDIIYYHYENCIFRGSSYQTIKWDKVMLSSNTPPDDDNYPSADYSIYVDDFIVSASDITDTEASPPTIQGISMSGCQMH